MIKQQLLLLRAFEQQYGQEESEKMITYLNDFVMITVDQATERFRTDNAQMKAEIMQKFTEQKLESAKEKNRIIAIMLSAIAIATAVISIFVSR